MSSKNNSADKTKNFVASLSAIESVLVETIEDGGQFTMVTAGTSMKPLLRNRLDSVVLVKPTPKLCKYDIPLYKRRSGQFTLHRIMKVCDDSYTMCGDNQLIFEKNVPCDSVVAVVSKVIRKGREIDLKKSRSYKMYVFFWCKCFFIRYFALKTYSLLSKIKRVFLKSNKK